MKKLSKSISKRQTLFWKKNKLFIIFLSISALASLLLVVQLYFNRKSSVSTQVAHQTRATEYLKLNDTSNWKTYTNYIYGFSFNYPAIQDQYYYTFADTGSFMLSTDQRIIGTPNGTPWLYITWKKSDLLSEDEYIKEQEMERQLYCNECSKRGTVQFGSHVFHAYDVTKLPDSENFVIKVPSSNLFIEVYDVNFPDEVRNAVLESIIFTPVEPSDHLEYKNQYYQFSYPSSWALSEGIWPHYSASVATESSTFRINVRALNFDHAQSMQQKIDGIHEYTTASSAWYDESIRHFVRKSQINVAGHIGYKYHWMLEKPINSQTSLIYIPFKEKLITIEMKGGNSSDLNRILNSFKFSEDESQ